MKTQTLYTKELAALYFTNSTPRAAITQFRRWIDRNESLKNELTETGYAAPCRVSFSSFRRTVSQLKIENGQLTIREASRGAKQLKIEN